VIRGLRAERIIRQLLFWGRKLGTEDFGHAWVLDGKVYLVDAHSVECLGDYFEYRQAVESGRRRLTPCESCEKGRN
jgi:hypothetical protein